MSANDSSPNTEESKDSTPNTPATPYKFKIDWLEDSRKNLAAFSKTLTGVKESRQNLENKIDDFHQYYRQKNKEFEKKQLLLKHAKEFPDGDFPFLKEGIVKSTLFICLGSIVLLEILSFTDQFPFRTALQLGSLNKKHREFLIESQTIWLGLQTLVFQPAGQSDPNGPFSVIQVQKGRQKTNSVISRIKSHFAGVKNFLNMAKILKNMSYPSETPNSCKSLMRDAFVFFNDYLESTSFNCQFRRHFLARITKELVISTMTSRLLVGDSLPVREEMLKMSCWLSLEVPSFQKSIRKFLSFKKIESDIKNVKMDYKITFLLSLLLHEDQAFQGVVIPVFQDSLRNSLDGRSQVTRIIWRILCKRENETQKEKMSGSCSWDFANEKEISGSLSFVDSVAKFKRKTKIILRDIEEKEEMPLVVLKKSFSMEVPKKEEKTRENEQIKRTGTKRETHIKEKSWDLMEDGDTIQVLIEEEHSSNVMSGFLKRTRMLNGEENTVLIAFAPDFTKIESFFF